MRKYKRPKRNHNNLYKSVSILLPASLIELLNKQSVKKRVPVSRLIGYAIDNELDCENPFTYNIDVSAKPYKEYLYAKEAGIILEHLRKMPTGSQRDVLILMRRDLGIESREAFLGGLQELYAKKLIEDFIVYQDSKEMIRTRAKGAPDKVRYRAIAEDNFKYQAHIKDDDIDRSEIE